MTATRLTISSLKTGDVVQAGYKQFLTVNRFIGFGSDRFASNAFNSLAELRSNVADSDCWFAVFQDCADGDEWAAYYHKNRWCVGSSADFLKLASVEA